MTTPARAQSILLAAASPCVSASGCPEKSSAGPQEMPLDAEEIHAKFFPGEEYSNNNQSEDQLPKEEVPGMEEALSHFSSDAVYYTEYENSQPRCEATPPMIKIPYRMMLDVPLETLELPAAEYQSKP